MEVREIYMAPPPTAATPNTPAVIRKIGLPILSSTLFFVCFFSKIRFTFRIFTLTFGSFWLTFVCREVFSVDEKIKSSPSAGGMLD